MKRCFVNENDKRTRSNVLLSNKLRRRHHIVVCRSLGCVCVRVHCYRRCHCWHDKWWEYDKKKTMTTSTAWKTATAIILSLQSSTRKAKRNEFEKRKRKNKTRLTLITQRTGEFRHNLIAKIMTANMVIILARAFKPKRKKIWIWKIIRLKGGH